MIPHERSLVQRLENEPFALIGVNSDPAEIYNEKVEEYQVSWRSFMVGSPDGDIPTRWNVTGWPTIFVIDHEGVIRYKNVRGEQMDKAVDTLLAKMHTNADGESGGASGGD